MAAKDSEKTRKPSYWLAIVAGAVILAWIGVEAAFGGFTDNVADAADVVLERGQAIIAAVTSLLAGALALRNFTPSAGTGDLPPDPVEDGPL